MLATKVAMLKRRYPSSQSGGADFYGRNPKELRTAFKKALRIFLEVCEEKGIEPRRHYS